MSVSHVSPPARRLTGAALGAALVLCSSLLAVAAPAPRADAAVQTSPYLASASGYGTRVTATEVGLQSGPTAYSVIGCFKATGLTKGNHIDATDLSSQVQVGAVTTLQRTVRTSTGYTVSRSATSIASVDLGSPTLGLRITGLQGISDARASASGRLTATNSFTFAGIQPRGPITLPPPLNQGADAILRTLATRAIVIPGVGVLSLGQRQTYASRSFARATAAGLNVHLFGSDQLNGTPDDSDVTLSRSYASLSTSAPHGVFGGGAWGVDGSLLGGASNIGRTPYTPLHCQGTYGKIQTQSLVGLNLVNQNQLVIGAMRNRIYGRQGVPTRGLTGWDESTVASVGLGGGAVQVSGIRAYAKIVRSSANRFYPSSSQSIGSLTVNGQTQAVPKPGRSIEVPNLVRIEVPAPVRTVNAVKVTALRLTLLGGSAAGTVINLGNAQASARYR